MVQKRSSLAVLISIISLFLIAGCGKGGDDTISAASPFLGGSQGLEIKFLKGSPPDEITNANFPFQAIVSIKNVGEHDITKGMARVDLSGILASDFGSNLVITGIQPADDPSSRKKDSEGNIIDAVETFATIPSSNVNLQLAPNAISGNTKFTFRADVCYQYQTDAIGSICVLSNMIDISDDAICSPKGSRTFSSSGSPVKVTSFRQSVVGEHKIQFSFDIVHSGSGNVFVPEPAATGCPKDVSNKRTKENRVKVTVNTGITGTGTLSCVGLPTPTTGSSVVLTDGKRTITCSQDVPASDFERNVDIKLEFNYQDSIDKEVLAKKLQSGTALQQQPTITFTANPTSIASAGQSSVLSWNAANANSCTASSTYGAWNGAKSTSGSEAVSPAATTQYSLTCTGAGGSQSATVTVSVGGVVTCGTEPNPRTIPLSGTINDFITCSMSNTGTGDAFMINTPTQGSATLTIIAGILQNDVIPFTIKQSTCTGANVAIGNQATPATFTAQQGFSYCVTVSSLQSNKVVTFRFIRP